VIGPATLEAVRGYQRAKSLPVDGFPSQTILKLLRSETPPVMVPAEASSEAPPAAVREGTGSIPEAAN